MGKKTTVGKEIVRSLKKLNQVIASGGRVTEHFTCTRVILKLEPRDYDPRMVKAVRRSLGVSQTLFAKFLGVSPSSVRSWEQGVNPVPAIACRFMDEIQACPGHWRERLLKAIVDKEVASK